MDGRTPAPAARGLAGGAGVRRTPAAARRPRNISSIMWGLCGGVYARYAHFPGQFNSAVQIVVIQMATL